jgi:electron transfer flavoprotein alpha/beta subunit
MANLVVFTELLGDGRPSPLTQLAIAEARAISNALGATIYAVAAVGPMDEEALVSLADSLGRSGADRVLVWPGSLLPPVPNYADLGHLLETIANRLRPRLFLFPQGAAAAQLAPMLAARVSADYVPGATASFKAASLTDGNAGELRLHRTHASKLSFDVVDVMDAERMIVCTLAEIDDPMTKGAGPAELEVLSLLPPPEPLEKAARSGRLKVAICVEGKPSGAALSATKLAAQWGEAEIFWIHAGAHSLPTNSIPTVVHSVTSIVAPELERAHDSSLALALATVLHRLDCDLILVGTHSDDQGTGLIGAAVAVQMKRPFVAKARGLSIRQSRNTSVFIGPELTEFVVQTPAVIACEAEFGAPLDCGSCERHTILSLADLEIEPATLRKASSW